MGLRAFNNPNSSFEDPYASTGTEAWDVWRFVGWYGTRGTFAAGYGVGGGVKNVIGYITIATTGNAQDFGDTQQTKFGCAGASNGSRGVIAGGYAGSTQLNEIGYITFATIGNATDFGDLTWTRRYLGSLSNGKRGVFGGGLHDSSSLNTIDYIP